jgi:hypothetical protein
MKCHGVPLRDDMGLSFSEKAKKKILEIWKRNIEKLDKIEDLSK